MIEVYDYEVVYSAALEKQGLCPSISRYTGGSTAGAAVAQGGAVSRFTRKGLTKPVERRLGPMPTYDQVLDRLRRGFTHRGTAKHFNVRLQDIRRMVRAAADRLRAENEARRVRPNTKVSADQVQQMRVAYEAGGQTQGQIALDFGICQPRVSQLVRPRRPRAA